MKTGEPVAGSGTRPSPPGPRRADGARYHAGSGGLQAARGDHLHGRRGRSAGDDTGPRSDTRREHLYDRRRRRPSRRHTLANGHRGRRLRRRCSPPLGPRLRSADALVISAGSSVSTRDLTAKVVNDLGESWSRRARSGAQARQAHDPRRSATASLCLGCRAIRSAPWWWPVSSWPLCSGGCRGECGASSQAASGGQARSQHFLRPGAGGLHPGAARRARGREYGPSPCSENRT